MRSPRGLEPADPERRSGPQPTTTSYGAFALPLMTAIGSNASSCLFGSGARGDAHEGSDYDIAGFWKGLTDRWREFHRLPDLRTEILADSGISIEARPFR